MLVAKVIIQDPGSQVTHEIVGGGDGRLTRRVIADVVR
jgi:hypothetical protein